ncbi:hypothetical protein CWE12_01740 [Aliidiomarina sedimenti]|uniref:Methyltransferase type 11 domain-containing protein n=2 Tax=Aliidiomarina sedimenti TaxID=1933879 RepID=A0ABY0C2C3_9GAMM|nr:hypothetical protein CWE12_01740 [Aliidiomarina sedimenti]
MRSENLPMLSQVAIDKQHIQHSFDRASTSYQRYNQLQQQVASSMLTMLGATNYPSLLDAGCGPGINYPALAGHCGDYIGLDLSRAMVNKAVAVLSAAEAKTNSTLIQGDLEAIGLATNSVDAVFSSLAIQWAHQPAEALAELVRVSKPGSPILISTVLADSLQPLSQLRTAIDGQPGANPQLSLSDWRYLLTQQQGLARWRCVEEQLTVYSPDLKTLLLGIKGVGATARNGGTLSPGTWRQLAADYEAYRSVAGLPLTYQIGFIEAYKE